MSAGPLGKLVRIVRAEGWDGVAERLVRSGIRRYAVDPEPLLLLPEDVVDPEAAVHPEAGPARPEGAPLEIGWVITPPAAGSGGHTTMFRFVEALEAAGHRCVLYLYPTPPGSLAEREAVIRSSWPRVRAEVRSVADGLPDMDAYVATAWQTAHVLARHGSVRGRRFYLAQDYEPYFYGRGAVSALAEDSYRFGFEVITVGQMVADELHRRFGTVSTVAPFGCDQEVYGLTNPAPRDEVVFYARPGVARRGYELGVLALAELTRRRPGVVVHTFGVGSRGLPFPAQVHASMTPAQLNELYNRCAAGLALSFTNISLIAYELLAAGAVPIVNDWAGSRADLDNPHVQWARPTPNAVADALERALDGHEEASPVRVTHSVDGVTWSRAGRTVVSAIEKACAAT